MTHRNLFCGVLLATGLIVPASAQDRSDPWAPARPLGRDIQSFKADPDAGENAPAVPERALSSVTLREALALAFRQNPDLAALAWEVRATEGRILQSRLIPNPEIGAEIENFGGSADRRNFDSAEMTLQISQTIELGGKRGRRTQVARTERSIAGWEYEAKRLEVYAETSTAFYDVISAQFRTDLRREQLALADIVVETARDRIAAGRVTSLEETRARIESSSNRIALERSRREVESARRRLVAAWGGRPAYFGTVEGNLEPVTAPPALNTVLDRIADNPDVQRWRTEIDLRRSALRLEQARNIPDVRLSAGIRRFSDTDDNAFVVGVSIPIPIFGINPGGVLEAERRLPQGREHGRAAVLRVETAAQQAHSELTAIYADISSLTRDVLPGAQQAYDAAQTGYREGQFGFLDVLDAQRTLFIARDRHLDALAAYQRVRIEIERLTGVPLTEMESTSRSGPRAP